MSGLGPNPNQSPYDPDEGPEEENQHEQANETMERPRRKAREVGTAIGKRIIENAGHAATVIAMEQTLNHIMRK